uniref:variable large family protein n=1 Tax=Borreliella garinii TaxID=29519 RepID=UPI0037BE93A1
DVGSSIEKAIGEISKQLSEMVKAAKGIAGAADAEDKIGDVGSAANKGAEGDQDSVNGIADGMKAIVDAAGGVEKVLKGVGAAGGGNNEAGKLFAGSNGANNGAGVNDVGKAVAAVNAVSGEQILKAIVEAAGGAEKGGEAADAAKNPIAAAIGTNNGDGAAFGGDMKDKNDKIAAAIVLRGMAKGGKFSLAAQNDAHKAGVKSAAQSGTAKTVNALTSIIQKAAEEGLKKVADAEGKIGDVGSANNKGAEGDQNSVNGIADGMKAIVDAAGGVEKVLKDVGAADSGGNNNDAGKLFAGSGAGAGGAAEADDVGKAVAAVNAVSGEQILKAIVEAAGGGDKVGAAANAAKNPIAAAIGTNGDGAAFGDDGMKNKNDKIAAAIVLRGMAKGGKFSLADHNDAAHKAGVKSAAQSGTAKTVNALTSIIQKAAEEGLKKVADAEGKIGDVGSADNKGAEGDQGSVNGIANGMKAIVDAAGGVEKVLKDVGAADSGGDNKDAGKLFAGSAGAGGAAEADVGKAVAAVNAVSGEQILKAIVEAAGGGEKGGAAAGAAKNPIAAAIGTNDGNGAAFGDNGMKDKNDKIAAAIVLRGMAKGGKFSLAAQNDAHKAGVKSAAQSGTAKTVNALTSIIQKAAEEGLKKVADAVKGIAASGKNCLPVQLMLRIRLGMLEVRPIKVLRAIRAVLMGLLMG